MRVVAGLSAFLASTLFVSGITLSLGADAGPVLILGGTAFGVVSAIAFWSLTREREAVLEAIADVRRTGVELRNRGLGLMKQAEVDEWMKERDNWRRDAIAKVKRLSKHEALGFETIGLTTDDDYTPHNYFSPEHAHQVTLLSADTRRLDDIRKRRS